MQDLYNCAVIIYMALRPALKKANLFLTLK